MNGALVLLFVFLVVFWVFGVLAILRIFRNGRISEERTVRYCGRCGGQVRVRVRYVDGVWEEYFAHVDDELSADHAPRHVRRGAAA